MNKARAVINGKPYLGIGLSRENCTRLLDGWSIQFDGAEIGLPGTRIVLYYNRAEQGARRRVGRWVPWRRGRSPDA